MKIVLLFALLIARICSVHSVVGYIGHNVTLKCTYEVKNNQHIAVCWGRGDIPLSGCGKTIISTNGLAVKGTSTSSRYQLLGQLDKGDVSLTILNITESDKGRYGCRVEIPGWMNDDKHHFNLIVKRAVQTTTSVTSRRETTTAHATTSQTTVGQLNATETPLTSSLSSIPAEQDNQTAIVVLVCALFALVALVTAGGIIIITKRWVRVNKIPQQQRLSSVVQFISPSSTLHLQTRSSGVENIYQLDDDGYEENYGYDALSIQERSVN